MARAEGSAASRAALWRARALLETERFAEALQACTDALARGVEDAQLRVVAAFALLAQGRVEGAKQEAQLLVRLDPSQGEAHRILADIHVERGELEPAREHLERVLALTPGDADCQKLWQALSSALPSSGDPETDGASTGDADPLSPLAFRGARVATIAGYIARSSAALVAGEQPAQRNPPAPLPQTPQPARGIIDGPGPLQSGEVVEVSDSMVEVLPSGPDDEVDEDGDGLSAPTVPAPLRLSHLVQGVPSGLFPRDVDFAGRISTADSPSPVPVPDPVSYRLPVGPLRGRTPRDGAAGVPGLWRPSAGPPLSAPPRASAESAEEPPRRRPPLPSGVRSKLEPERSVPASGKPPSPAAHAAPGAGPRGPILSRRGPIHRVDSDDSAFEDFEVEPASAPHQLPAPDPISAGRAAAHELRAATERLGSAVDGATGSRGNGAADSGIFGLMSCRASTEDSQQLVPPWTATEDSLAAAKVTGPGRGRAGDSLATDLVNVPALGKGGGSAGRWLLVAFFGLVLGGGGVFGFLFYREYQFRQAEWQAVRAGTLSSTPEGFRRALAASRAMIARKPDDEAAQAAAAMSQAALSVEFGEDRVPAAKHALARLKGTDSEWRTAANAFLSLTDDPARVVGYLEKAVEVYGDSVLLKYLLGRALASSGEPVKARARYEAALAQKPGYVAAQIGLATLAGGSRDGFPAALRALDGILAQSPDNLQALLERAKLRVRYREGLDEALADATRVVTTHRTQAGQGQLGWGHLLLALVADSKDDAATMDRELTQAVQSPAVSDAEFRAELSSALLRASRFAEAEQQMAAARALKPNESRYRTRMARILLELEHPSEAQALLQAMPVRSVTVRYLLSRTAYEQRRYVAAQKLAVEVLAAKRGHLGASRLVALCLAAQHKFPRALHELGLLIKAQPKNPKLQLDLARVQLGAGNLDAAHAAVKAAWALTQRDPLAQTLSARVSLKKHDPATARKRLERALASRPDFRQALLLLARLDLEQGALEQARTRLARISPVEQKTAAVLGLLVRVQIQERQFAEARQTIALVKPSGGNAAQQARLTGELAFYQGELKEALAELTKAARLGVRSTVEFLVLLGQAQLENKQLDAAFTSFDGALAKDPDHPEALLGSSKLAIDDGELGIAFDRLQKALTAAKARGRPSGLIARIHTLKGEAHLKQRDTGRALTELQDAVELDRTAPQPLVLLGMTYDKLERPERAVTYYEQALALAPNHAQAKALLAAAQAKAPPKP